MLNSYLLYENNSCYIDSVFIAIFHNPYSEISKYMISKNNKIINNLILDLHNNKDFMKITILRKYFYDKTKNKEWLYDQQDPMDVIDILIKLLNINETLILNTELKYFNFIYILPNQTKKIIKFFNKIIFIKYKFLFINIIRNNNGVKNEDIAIPCENIGDLHCSSIIIHHGSSVSSGHFTCIFKKYKTNKWFHYDDLNTKYEEVDDIYNWKNKYILKNSCSFIYTK